MSIYQEQILDHFHNPRHYGILDHPTHQSDTKNISCGDALHMDIIVKDGIIRDIGFYGNGCAISQASASLLAEYICHKPVAEAKALKKGDVEKLIGIDLSPNRLKCAILSLETLHKALNNIL
ncbi:MAG: iron-sulfur cluster assembly scaffold protein [Candidatus Moranbacteria bacterium]|nr:iron-sulfur cluster assembly scaffold protein [Candidatus Moranbacteria bacterium]